MGNDLLERTDRRVCILTLNRPERRNALTLGLIQRLSARLRNALESNTIRGVVLTGSPPAFCAGLDLTEFGLANASPHAKPTDDGNRQQALREANEGLFDLYEAVRVAPKPVVAAVNGPAVAGGAGLATACDFAVAARGATIGYPAIQRGLVAAVVVRPLVDRVGPALAKRLLLSGNLLSAEQALRWRMVDRIVDDEAVVDAAVDLLERLSAYPAGAYGDAKQLFDRVQRVGASDEQARRVCSEMRVHKPSREGGE